MPCARTRETSARRWALPLAWVVFAVALAFSADAKGAYDSCCHRTTFRLAVVPQNQFARKVTLRLDLGGLYFGPYLAGADWWNANAEICPQTGKCEEASKAKLSFAKITEKRVSGNYVLDFKEWHSEGKF